MSIVNRAIYGNYSGGNPTISARGYLELRGTTLTGNSSLQPTIVSSGTKPAISDSIIWENSAPGNVSILVLGVYPRPFEIDHCDIERGRAAIQVEDGATVTWGLGNIDRDPLFMDPRGKDGNGATWEDNDYSLSSASPCIDTSLRAWNAAEIDLTGSPRFVDGNGDHMVAADMGAYELQGKSCRADLNYDGIVNDHDLLLFWNRFDVGDSTADFNHDGFITGDDWDEFIAAFVSGC